MKIPNAKYLIEFERLANTVVREYLVLNQVNYSNRNDASIRNLVLNIRGALEVIFKITSRRLDGLSKDVYFEYIDNASSQISADVADHLFLRLGKWEHCATTENMQIPKYYLSHSILNHSRRLCEMAPDLPLCEYSIIDKVIEDHLFGIPAIPGPFRGRGRRNQGRLHDSLWRPPVFQSPVLYPAQLNNPCGEEACHLNVALETVTSEIYTKILQDPTYLSNLSWQKVEDLVVQILKDFGYYVENPKRTKDGGIDVMAIQRDGRFGEELYIVQVKHWNGKVGVSPVRELAFIRQETGATKACLATTSHFTKGAWELFNKYHWMLDAKDYDGILHWVRLAWQLTRE